MIKLYGTEISGNSYKAKLLLCLLGMDYEWVDINPRKGENKSPEFLAINPLGQIPVLVDDTMVLPDAQAILVYLARRYGGDTWFPLDAEPMSRVVRWLSTSAGEIRQGPEFARRYHKFGATGVNLDWINQKSEFILTQVDQHLANREWLELNRPTIADIAAFPYIALAPEGKISLDNYSNILAWIERIKKLPGFVGMPGIEVPINTTL
ncbi:MAG: glutathione S-transferase [Rhizonema sp. PD37]|nr:glutathione S-transferase [Rhizonema sp. PD37]